MRDALNIGLLFNMNAISSAVSISAIIFVAASARSESISLVSDLGDVIDVRASLHDNRLHIKHLEGVTGVLHVSADYMAGLLYVIEDTQPNLAMTRVYNLNDLHLIAMLPGVTDVQIPKQSEAKAFITRSHKFSAEYQGMFISELLQDGRQESVLYEVRDRRLPKETLAHSDNQNATSYSTSLYPLNGACYRREKYGFSSDSPNSWFAMNLSFKGVRIDDEDMIFDCTSNGAFWQHDYLFISKDIHMEIRLEAPEGVQRFLVNKETSGFPKLRALGESAAVVFYEDVVRQRLTLLEVGHKPMDIKGTMPMRGDSNQFFELGWGKKDDAFYFVGGRRMKGAIRVTSNQVYRLAKTGDKWFLSPIDLDRLMLMYLEFHRSETTIPRPIAGGQLIAKKPELRLEGNEEAFRVIGVF